MVRGGCGGDDLIAGAHHNAASVCFADLIASEVRPLAKAEDFVLVRRAVS